MLRERGHQRVWGVRHGSEGGEGQPSHAPPSEPLPPAQWPPQLQPQPQPQHPATAPDRLSSDGGEGHISYTASAYSPPPPPPPPPYLPPPPPPPPQQQQQHQVSATAPDAETRYGAGAGADASADVTPQALRDELRDLDSEMSSLHQSLFEAAARFGATLPRPELGAVPAARGPFPP